MKSDYLEKRVLKEWIEILSSVEDNIEKTIKKLTIIYSKKGKKGYKYIKLISDKIKYLFPKEHEILKPFRYIKPSDIRVIIIGNHPRTRGNSTGIPFDEKEKEFLFDTNAAIDQEQSVIVDCLKKSNLIDTRGINVMNWYNQGVLTLYASLTACSTDGEVHYALWDSIIKTILVKLYNLNGSIIYVPFGYEAKKLIDSTVISNTALIIDSVAPCKYPLDTYNTFVNSDVFKQINYFLKKPINW